MNVCVCEVVTVLVVVLWMWQVGFVGSSEVFWALMCLHVNVESKHFEIWTVRKPGRSEETGDQTNQREGGPGSYSDSLYGGWGQGPRPIQPALRHRDKGPITLLQPRPP